MLARTDEAHVERAPEAIAEQIEAGDGQEDRQDRQEQAARRVVDVLTGIGDHLAPGGLVGADAEADEGQDRLHHDGDAHFEAHQRDEEWQSRGKDLARDGAPMREADQSCGGDIVALLDHQHLAAQHAAEAGPIHQHDGEDHLVEPGAEPDHQDQRQDHRRERHPYIDDAPDDPVDRAAEIAGEVRQDRADRHGAERGDDRDRHGGARAVDQPRQLVAAEAVGAERESAVAARHPCGRQQDVEQVLVVRVGRGEIGREPVSYTHLDVYKRQDIFLAPLDQRCRAHQAGILRPLHQHDGEDHLVEPGAEPDHQDQRQDHRRERHPYIDDAPDDPVDRAAEIAGEVRQDRADRHGAERGDDRDRHGGARAVDQPRQLVAAEAVGAERESAVAARHPCGRQQDVEQVLVVRVGRGEIGREPVSYTHLDVYKRQDIFLAPLDQRCRAHQAGILRPLHQHDGEDHLVEPGAEPDHQDQRQDHRRERHPYIDDAPDDPVDRAAEIAGEVRQDRADRHGAERGDDRDRHGGARAVDQPRQLVAAEAVGAERESAVAARHPCGRQQDVEQVLVVRVGRGEIGREPVSYTHLDVYKRQDIFLAPLDQRCRAHQAGILRPLHQHDGEDHLVEPGAEPDHQDQRQDHRRERHPYIDDAPDDPVDRAAEIAGEVRQDRADRHGAERGDDRDRHGGARAVDQPRQLVAAEAVGAERESAVAARHPCGRQQDVEQVLVVRVGRGEIGREPVSYTHLDVYKRQDIFLAPLDQRCRAHQAGILRPLHQHDGEDHLVEPGAEPDHQDQRQDHRRERHPYIDDAPDDPVDRAAEIAGEVRQDRADRHGAERGDDRDRHGGARAVDQPRQLVAAEAVGAERESAVAARHPCGRQQDVEQVLVVRVGRGEIGREPVSYTHLDVYKRQDIFLAPLDQRCRAHQAGILRPLHQHDGEDHLVEPGAEPDHQDQRQDHRRERHPYIDDAPDDPVDRAAEIAGEVRQDRADRHGAERGDDRDRHGGARAVDQPRQLVAAEAVGAERESAVAARHPCGRQQDVEQVLVVRVGRGEIGREPVSYTHLDVYKRQDIFLAPLDQRCRAHQAGILRPLHQHDGEDHLVEPGAEPDHQDQRQDHRRERHPYIDDAPDDPVDRAAEIAGEVRQDRADRHGAERGDDRDRHGGARAVDQPRQLVAAEAVGAERESAVAARHPCGRQQDVEQVLVVRVGRGEIGREPVSYTHLDVYKRQDIFLAPLDQRCRAHQAGILRPLHQHDGEDHLVEPGAEPDHQDQRQDHRRERHPYIDDAPDDPVDRAAEIAGEVRQDRADRHGAERGDDRDRHGGARAVDQPRQLVAAEAVGAERESAVAARHPCGRQQDVEQVLVVRVGRGEIGREPVSYTHLDVYKRQDIFLAPLDQRCRAHQAGILRPLHQHDGEDHLVEPGAEPDHQDQRQDHRRERHPYIDDAPDDPVDRAAEIAGEVRQDRADRHGAERGDDRDRHGGARAVDQPRQLVAAEAVGAERESAVAARHPCGRQQDVEQVLVVRVGRGEIGREPVSYTHLDVYKRQDIFLAPLDQRCRAHQAGILRPLHQHDGEDHLVEPGAEPDHQDQRQDHRRERHPYIDDAPDDPVDRAAEIAGEVRQDRADRHGAERGDDRDRHGGARAVDQPRQLVAAEAVGAERESAVAARHPCGRQQDVEQVLVVRVGRGEIGREPVSYTHLDVYKRQDIFLAPLDQRCRAHQAGILRPLHQHDGEDHLVEPGAEPDHQDQRQDHRRERHPYIDDAPDDPVDRAAEIAGEVRQDRADRHGAERGDDRDRHGGARAVDQPRQLVAAEAVGAERESAVAARHPCGRQQDVEQVLVVRVGRGEIGREPVSYTHLDVYKRQDIFLAPLDQRCRAHQAGILRPLHQHDGEDHLVEPGAEPDHQDQRQDHRRERHPYIDDAPDDPVDRAAEIAGEVRQDRADRHGAERGDDRDRHGGARAVDQPRQLVAAEAVGAERESAVAARHPCGRQQDVEQVLVVRVGRGEIGREPVSYTHLDVYKRQDIFLAPLDQRCRAHQAGILRPLHQHDGEDHLVEPGAEPDHQDQRQDHRRERHPYIDDAPDDPVDRAAEIAGEVRQDRADRHGAERGDDRDRHGGARAVDQPRQLVAAEAVGAERESAVAARHPCGRQQDVEQVLVVRVGRGEIGREPVSYTHLDVYKRQDIFLAPLDQRCRAHQAGILRPLHQHDGEDHLVEPGAEPDHQDQRQDHRRERHPYIDDAPDDPVDRAAEIAGEVRQDRADRHGAERGDDRDRHGGARAVDQPRQLVAAEAVGAERESAVAARHPCGRQQDVEQVLVVRVGRGEIGREPVSYTHLDVYKRQDIFLAPLDQRCRAHQAGILRPLHQHDGEDHLVEPGAEPDHQDQRQDHRRERHPYIDDAPDDPVDRAAEIAGEVRQDRADRHGAERGDDRDRHGGARAVDQPRQLVAAEAVGAERESAVAARHPCGRQQDVEQVLVVRVGRGEIGREPVSYTHLDVYKRQDIFLAPLDQRCRAHQAGILRPLHQHDGEDHLVEPGAEPDHQDQRQDHRRERHPYIDDAPDDPVDRAAEIAGEVRQDRADRHGAERGDDRDRHGGARAVDQPRQLVAAEAVGAERESAVAARHPCGRQQDVEQVLVVRVGRGEIGREPVSYTHLDVYKRQDIFLAPLDQRCRAHQAGILRPLHQHDGEDHLVEPGAEPDHQDQRQDHRRERHPYIDDAPDDPVDRAAEIAGEVRQDRADRHGAERGDDRDRHGGARAVDQPRQLVAAEAVGAERESAVAARHPCGRQQDVEQVLVVRVGRGEIGREPVSYTHLDVYKRQDIFLAPLDQRCRAHQAGILRPLHQHDGEDHLVEPGAEPDHQDQRQDHRRERHPYIDDAPDDPVDRAAEIAGEVRQDRADRHGAERGDDRDRHGGARAVDQPRQLVAAEAVGAERESAVAARHPCGRQQDVEQVLVVRVGRGEIGREPVSYTHLDVYKRQDIFLAPLDQRCRAHQAGILRPLHQHDGEDHLVEPGAEPDHQDQRQDHRRERHPYIDDAPDDPVDRAAEIAGEVRQDRADRHGAERGDDRDRHGGARAVDQPRQLVAAEAVGAERESAVAARHPCGRQQDVEQVLVVRVGRGEIGREPVSYTHLDVYKRQDIFLAPLDQRCRAHQAGILRPLHQHDGEDHLVEPGAEPDHQDQRQDHRRERHPYIDDAPDDPVDRAAEIAGEVRQDRADRHGAERGDDRDRHGGARAVDQPRQLVAAEAVGAERESAVAARHPCGRQQDVEQVLVVRVGRGEIGREPVSYTHLDVYKRQDIFLAPLDQRCRAHQAGILRPLHQHDGEDHLVEPGAEPDHQDQRQDHRRERHPYIDDAPDDPVDRAAEIAGEVRQDRADRHGAERGDDRDRHGGARAVDQPRQLVAAEAVGAERESAVAARHPCGRQQDVEQVLVVRVGRGEIGREPVSYTHLDVYKRQDIFLAPLDQRCRAHQAGILRPLHQHDGEDHLVEPGAEPDHQDQRQDHRRERHPYIDDAPDDPVDRAAEIAGEVRQDRADRHGAERGDDRDRHGGARAVDQPRQLVAAEAVGAERESAVAARHPCGRQQDVEQVLVVRVGRGEIGREPVSYTHLDVYKRQDIFLAPLDQRCRAHQAGILRPLHQHDGEDHLVEPGAEPDHQDQRQDHRRERHPYIDDAPDDPVDRAAEIAGEVRQDRADRHGAERGDDRDRHGGARAVDQPRQLVAAEAVGAERESAVAARHPCGRQQDVEQVLVVRVGRGEIGREPVSYTHLDVYKRQDIFLAPLDQRCRAHQAGILRPLHQHDGEDHLVEPGAEPDHQDQRQDHRRERHPYIDDAPDDPVDRAAEIAGEVRQDRADRHGAERGDDRDRHGGARAVDQPRQLVAAEAVGAERESAVAARHPCGRQQDVEQVLVVRVGRGEIGREPVSYTHLDVYKRQDIFLAPLDQRCRAHQAGILRPLHQHDGEDHLVEPGAEPDHQDQRQDHRRERHPYIDDAPDDPVDRAAEIAGEVRQDRADRHGAERGDDRDRHGGARAVDQPRQLVAAEAVGAERESAVAARHPCGRQQDVEQVLVVRVGRGEIGREPVSYTHLDVYKRQDIFLAPLDQRCRAHQAGILRPLHQHDGEDHLVEPGAEPDHQDQRQDHRRERHPYIDDAPDDPVDRAAEIAGEVRQDRADRHGAERGDDRDRHGGARAVDQPRQLVAAEAVGAERESAVAARHPCGRQQDVEQVLVVRVGRGEIGREPVSYTHLDVYKRQDIFLAPLDQRCRAHQAGILRPLHQHDGEDHLVEPGAEPDHQDQRQDHRRERHPYIDDAPDDPVDRAAEIAGEVRQDRADRHGAERGDDRDRHGGARAVDQPRQLVAAEAVGAERESAVAARHPCGRQQDVEQVLVVRVGRGEIGREQRAEENDEDDAEAHHDAAGAQAAVERLHGQALRSFGLSTR